MERGVKPMTVGPLSSAKRLRSGVAVLSLCIGLGVLSSPAGAETLDEALARTYLDNPTLRATRAELRGVDEGVAQARSGWRPNVEVNGGAGLSYQDRNVGSVSTSDGTVPLAGSIDVVQPLYTGGRTDAQVDAAEKDVEAQRALLAAVEQSVLRDGVTAYMNVWSAEAVLSLNQTTSGCFAVSFRRPATGSRLARQPEPMCRRPKRASRAPCPRGFKPKVNWPRPSPPMNR